MRLKYRLELVAEYEGKPVVDSRTARLLQLIDEHGSILSASRMLNIPYSSTWDLISRIERLLGERVVEARKGGRGGGGARLTDFGRRLLDEYLRRARSLVGRAEVKEVSAEVCDVVYAGSHDPQLELIFGELRRLGECVEVHWVGSAGGLASIMLGDADIAGVHLYDPYAGTFNITYLGRYWLEDKVVLVRGYARELGVVYRRGVQVDSLKDVVKYRIVNRNAGSGTRVYLDFLLGKVAEELGVEFKELTRRLAGYGKEVRTHLEVVSAIARGEADVGLAIRWAAELYGLPFKRLILENFDFVIPKQSLKKRAIKELIKLLRGSEPKLPGYARLKDSGRIVWPPS